MKCPRCGYISFDYLNQCSKCGQELQSVKMELNLLSQKPNPPFLLGPLLMGAVKKADAGSGGIPFASEDETVDAIIPVPGEEEFPELGDLKEALGKAEPIVQLDSEPDEEED